MRLASLLSFRIALSIDNCIASIEAIPLMPVKGTEGQQQQQQQQQKTPKKNPKKKTARRKPGTSRVLERTERKGGREMGMMNRYQQRRGPLAACSMKKTKKKGKAPPIH